jgi:4'-phosphopantetheinyl transferase EntD
MVTLPEERDSLARLADHDPAVAWDRLLFSAKESVYKTWFPLTGGWLGFEECRIELDPGGTFTGRLLVPGPVVRGERLGVLHGRWQTSGAVLITAIVLTGRCSDDST